MDLVVKIVLGVPALLSEVTAFLKAFNVVFEIVAAAAGYKTLVSTKEASTLTPAFLTAYVEILAVFAIVVLVLFYKVKAQLRKDLDKESSIEDKLNDFIDQEMNPLMEAMETGLSREMENTLDDKIGKLANILNDIKIQKNINIDGKENCILYQRCLNITLAALGSGGLIFVLPSVLGALIVVVMPLSGAGFVYNKFGQHREKYDESLNKLIEMDEKAKTAKENLNGVRN